MILLCLRCGIGHDQTVLLTVPVQIQIARCIVDGNGQLDRCAILKRYKILFPPQSSVSTSLRSFLEMRSEQACWKRPDCRFRSVHSCSVQNHQWCPQTCLILLRNKGAVFRVQRQPCSGCDIIAAVGARAADPESLCIVDFCGKCADLYLILCQTAAAAGQHAGKEIAAAAAAALFIKVRRVIFSAIILPSSKSVLLCF